MTAQKKQVSVSPIADSSGGKNKNKHNNSNKNKKTGFKGAQTDGVLQGSVISQGANTPSQLRVLCKNLTIKAVVLGYDLWSGSIEKGERIRKQDYIDKPRVKSEYTFQDPNDASKTFEDTDVKSALYEIWKVEMVDQNKRMIQYTIDGKILCHILAGQVDPQIIQKLQHKTE